MCNACVVLAIRLWCVEMRDLMPAAGHRHTATLATCSEIVRGATQSNNDKVARLDVKSSLPSICHLCRLWLYYKSILNGCNEERFQAEEPY